MNNHKIYQRSGKVYMLKNARQAIFYEAITNGNKQMIEEILKKDVDLKSIDDKGDTFLHVVFRNKECSQAQLIEILEIFLDRGLDINVRNSVGKTILHFAVERRMREVIDFCLRRDADPNTTDGNGNTIAHFVIEEEYKKVHSLINNENLKLHENELGSSFVDWIASQKIDFFYKRNCSNYSALYLANSLNLQHILLSLLKQIDDLSSAEKDNVPLLLAFLERNSINPRIKFSIFFKPINSSYYNSRHMHDIVKIILEKNTSISDTTLAIALRSAITNNLEMNVIEILLQRVNSVNLSEVYGESLLQALRKRFIKCSLRRLSMQDNMNILRALILKGSDISKQEGNGKAIGQILFRMHSTMEMLELLKDGGFNFSARTQLGESFLHLVSHRGKEARMVDFLVNDYNFDVNIIDSNGDTPLKVAITSKNGLVAVRLIECGANVNYINNQDDTSAMSTACATGQAGVVEKLIEHGAALEYRDSNGQTLLHLAAGSPEVIELLIKNGADVNARNTMGKTPLHYAATAVAVEVLFRAGARVDVLDKHGISPFQDSLTRRKSDVVAEFVECGADVQDLRVLKLLDNLFLNYRRIFSFLIDCYLKKYFVKLVAAGLDVKIPYTIKKVKEVYTKFFVECQLEAELLKAFFIDDHTSLYQFLHKNRNRRCAYVNNEKLKNLLEDYAIEEKFPNYAVLILGYYNEAAARKSLMQLATEAWYNVKDIHLPELCIDKILTYMSNIDLMCFTEAYEDVNLDGLNEPIVNMRLSA